MDKISTPKKGSYELISLVKRLNSLLSQNIDVLLKPFGLARTQYQVLYHAQGDDGMPTKQLQERLQVEAATMSGLIDTLEAKGLVTRMERADDKRRKDIHLTAAGRKLLQAIPPPGPIMEHVMLMGIDGPETTKIKEAARHMVRNLEENLEI